MVVSDTWAAPVTADNLLRGSAAKPTEKIEGPQQQETLLCKLPISRSVFFQLLQEFNIVLKIFIYVKGYQ